MALSCNPSSRQKLVENTYLPFLLKCDEIFKLFGRFPFHVFVLTAVWLKLRQKALVNSNLKGFQSFIYFISQSKSGFKLYRRAERKHENTFPKKNTILLMILSRKLVDKSCFIFLSKSFAWIFIKIEILRHSFHPPLWIFLFEIFPVNK